MKKRKWNRVLSVLLVMVTVISLMSGCGKKSAKMKRKIRSQYIYGAQSYMKNMHHIFRNSFQILILNL